MEKAEQEREKIYDVVLIVRYDLTYGEFFWTEAGAKSQFAFGLMFPPQVGFRVTGKQLTVFQNLGHEYLNAHKMCEYGHLERTDTVEQLKRCVQCALEGGLRHDPCDSHVRSFQ